LSWGRALGPFGGLSTRQLTVACRIWKETTKKESTGHRLIQELALPYLTANDTSKTAKITKKWYYSRAHWHLCDVLVGNHIFV